MTAKRAQAEAIGLLFIVLLIFVVIIIVAKLEDKNPKLNIREEYETTQISSSTLNTFLAMNKQSCLRKTYAEILTDCIKDDTSKCNSMSSNCDVFYGDMERVLAEVFSEHKLNMKYDFTIRSTGILPLEWDNDPTDGVLDEDMHITSAKPCSKSYRGEDFILPIRSGLETVTITLTICH